jgi:hypothetical protein
MSLSSRYGTRRGAICGLTLELLDGITDLVGRGGGESV